MVFHAKGARILANKLNLFLTFHSSNINLAMSENEISYKIIGAALELHKNIGPGLLESTFEHALAYDLKTLGLAIK